MAYNSNLLQSNIIDTSIIASEESCHVSSLEHENVTDIPGETKSEVTPQCWYILNRTWVHEDDLNERQKSLLKRYGAPKYDQPGGPNWYCINGHWTHFSDLDEKEQDQILALEEEENEGQPGQPYPEKGWYILKMKWIHWMDMTKEQKQYARAFDRQMRQFQDSLLLNSEEAWMEFVLEEQKFERWRDECCQSPN